MNDQAVVARIILTRPNKNVEFRTVLTNMSPNELRFYIEDTYNRPGKILSRIEVISEDGLTLTLSTLHRSNQDRIEHMSDPVIIDMHNVHRAYWVANNIKAEWVNEELAGDVVARSWQGFFNNP